MKKSENVLVTDHTFEIRHEAVGSFLDVRGFVADYVRSNRFLSHWKIDANVVLFRDHPEKVEKEGAFAGYKSFGYFTYSPPTKDFFEERASLFLKLVSKNQHYRIPPVSRFGCRSKVFIPLENGFDAIKSLLYENVISGSIREIFGKKETDLQVVIEYKEKQFDGRLILGPMHKDEMKNRAVYESEHFSKAGVFMDIDYFNLGDFELSKGHSVLKEAMGLTWAKVDGIAQKLGI